MHNAGIKWFVVVWPTVLTSCTAEIPGLDDKAILVEYNVLEVPEGEKENHSIHYHETLIKLSKNQEFNKSKH